MMNTNVKIKNKIADVIATKENEGIKFRPNRAFFDKVQIGQKRFGQLLRNEKPADLNELSNISQFFDVSIYELIEI